MNQRQTNRQRYFGFLFLPLLLFMVAACSSNTESATPPITGVVPQVFVFPTGTDKRLISDERILQNNCDGTAEMSQTVTRQHTVQYTMEIGTGLTVSAEGKVGVPGVGEVGVGTEVAAHYKVGYGRQETVSRSQTVAAAPKSHIQHTIQQFEIWETGEVLVVVSDQNQRLPYSFRRDFSIEAVAPANVGCSTSLAHEIEPTTVEPTSRSTIESNMIINGRSFSKPNPSSTPYCVAQEVHTNGENIVDYTVTVPDGWVMMWSSWKAQWPGGGYDDSGLLTIKGPWNGTVTINTGGSCSGPSEWFDFILQNRRSDYPIPSRPEFTIP